MSGIIQDFLRDKKVCILGFGAEGQSGYRAIRRYFPDMPVTISDKDHAVETHCLLQGDQHITFLTGEGYLHGLNDFDLILKSPGIPFSLLAHVNRGRISSQTELFIRAYRRQIIGITGTKGKSTTSSLVHHIMLQHNSNSLLLGNIGVPFFEKIDHINDETIIVCEMSSHQLENLRVSPHISVLLNLFEEHLDHFPSYHDYQLAKYNIAKFQEKEDYFIFNADDERFRQLIDEFIPRGRFLPFSFTMEPGSGCYLSDYDLLYKKGDKKLYRFDTTISKHLKGDHNMANIMAAVCACQLVGIPDEAISSGIRSFIPLEHRMEFAGRFHGIDFYNDSIATIPEAVIAAVKTVNHVDTLILGGFNRGVDYARLVTFVKESAVRNLVFMGNAGERMMGLLEAEPGHRKNVFFASGLQEAVEWAKKNTAPEKACLLSPAAASYDAFRNFAERGTAFKKFAAANGSPE